MGVHGQLTQAEIAAMRVDDTRHQARRDDVALRTRGVLPSTGEVRKFNPNEPRDPHSGKWSDGVPGSAALKDGLKLAGRIQLGNDETLGGSGKVGLENDDVALLWAAVDSPNGRQIRLGVLPGEDTDKWRAANKGATANLSAADAARLRDELAAASAKAKAAAKEVDNYWHSGQAAPPQMLSEAVAEGRIASPWGDLTYSVYLTDDDPASYLTTLHVGDSETADGATLTPTEVRKFARTLGDLARQ